MIQIKPYTKDSKTLWNDFNASAKNGLFMFDRDYMDYHSDRFSDHSLMFYEDEKLLALLPLNLKDDTLYSHQGLTFGGFITSTTMKQEKCANASEFYANICPHSTLRISFISLSHTFITNSPHKKTYTHFSRTMRIFIAWIAPQQSL